MLNSNVHDRIIASLHANWQSFVDEGHMPMENMLDLLADPDLAHLRSEEYEEEYALLLGWPVDPMAVSEAQWEIWNDLVAVAERTFIDIHG